MTHAALQQSAIRCLVVECVALHEKMLERVRLCRAGDGHWLVDRGCDPRVRRIAAKPLTGVGHASGLERHAHACPVIIEMPAASGDEHGRESCSVEAEEPNSWFSVAT